MVVKTPHQDMNLMKLMQRYQTEEKCCRDLEELRWLDGVNCPRCESLPISQGHVRQEDLLVALDDCTC